MFGRKRKKKSQERRDADRAVVALYEKRLAQAQGMPAAADRFLALRAIVDDASLTIQKRHELTENMVPSGERVGELTGGATGMGVLATAVLMTDISGLSAAAFGVYMMGKYIGGGISRTRARARRDMLDSETAEFENLMFDAVVLPASLAANDIAQTFTDELMLSPRRSELEKYESIRTAFAAAATRRLPPAKPATGFKPGLPGSPDGAV